VTDRLKFIILARLVLLRAQPRDRITAGPNIQLKFLAIDLHLPCALFEPFKRSHRARELRLKALSLQWNGSYFVLDLPDLLLSVLQDQQLFQLQVHGRQNMGAAQPRQ
jgi:hypothetical protein